MLILTWYGHILNYKTYRCNLIISFFQHLLYPITRLVIQKIPNGMAVQMFKYVMQIIRDSKRKAVVETKYGRWSNDSIISFRSDLQSPICWKIDSVLDKKIVEFDFSKVMITTSYIYLITTWLLYLPQHEYGQYSKILESWSCSRWRIQVKTLRSLVRLQDFHNHLQWKTTPSQKDFSQFL